MNFLLNIAAVHLQKGNQTYGQCESRTKVEHNKTGKLIKNCRVVRLKEKEQSCRKGAHTKMESHDRAISCVNKTGEDGSR